MFRRIIPLLAVVLVVVLVVPGLSPVRVSYVTSDSMEPTMAVGDGFLVWTGGDAAVGDAVTFRAEHRDRSVTHRLVGRTPEGFVTRGDNNPSTDQAAGYTHVRREEIVGTVVTLGGDPLVIPGLGTAVELARSYRTAILGLAGVALLLSLRSTGSSPRKRDVQRAGRALLPVFLVGAVVVAGAVLWGAQTQTFQYVAVEGGSASGPSTVPVGEPSSDTIVVDRTRETLTSAVVATEGMTLTNRTANASTVRLSVRIPAQAEPGPVTASVRVQRYPRVLPHSTLRALDAVHPLVPTTVTAALVFGPLAALALLLIDRRAPVRTRGRRVTRGSGGER